MADRAFPEFFERNFSGYDPYRLFYEFSSALSQMINFIERKRQAHAHHVAAMSYHLGARSRRLTPQQLRDTYFAGLLHDIGEISIFDTILAKKGSLNREERNALSRHTRIGANIIRQIPTLENAAALVVHHHERWDGTGYPDGLLHNTPPLGSQLISLCDAFDVVYHMRFRDAEDPARTQKALGEIRRNAGLQFNPELVTLLGDALEETSLREMIELREEDEAVLETLTVEHPEFGEFYDNYIDILLDFFNIVLEAKDRQTAAHCRRVGDICRELGEVRDLSGYEIETLEIAGRLHDVGKIAVPHQLLDPHRPLDEEQLEEFHRHPNFGRQILEQITGFERIVELVGSNPDGRKNELDPENLGEDPLLAILRAANLWDEIASYPYVNRLSRILETTLPVPSDLTELESRVIECVLD